MAARRALIVAIGEYEHEGLRRLSSPEADADALAAVLGDPAIGGFEVEVVRDQPAHDVQARIEDLFSEARPDDLLLLHFSCHGLKSEQGELFFAARNTRPNRLASTAVPADFVQRCVRSSRSRSIVLFLDCCYGGAFGQGVAVRAGDGVNLLDSFPGGRLGGGRGRAVISASNAVEYAFEGENLIGDGGIAPSRFTSAVVQGLATGEADRDEDGWISLNELYDYVFDQVRATSPNQTPSRDIEMQGELYLARSSRRRVRPATVPAELRAAATDPNMFSRTGAVAELRARLLGDNLAAAAGARELLAYIAANDIEFVAAKAKEALSEARLVLPESAVDLGEVAPVSQPPGSQPPVSQPPVSQPPVSQPPGSQPPGSERAASAARRYGPPRVEIRATGLVLAGLVVILASLVLPWFDDQLKVTDLRWDYLPNGLFLPQWWLTLGLLIGAAALLLTGRRPAVAMGLAGGAGFSATSLALFAAGSPSNVRSGDFVYAAGGLVVLAGVGFWAWTVRSESAVGVSRRPFALAGAVLVVAAIGPQLGPDQVRNSVIWAVCLLTVSAAVLIPVRLAEPHRVAVLTGVTAYAVVAVGSVANYLIRFNTDDASLTDSSGRFALAALGAAGLWLGLQRVTGPDESRGR